MDRLARSDEECSDDAASDTVASSSAARLRPDSVPEPPAAPEPGAAAMAWQVAYEALRDANAELEASMAPATNAAEPATPEPPVVAPSRSRSDAELVPKVLSVLNLAMRPETESKRLAEVAELREMLGPGTLPTLAALFGLPASTETMPASGAIREALALAGTTFRTTTSVDLGRCCVVRGTFDQSGDAGSARAFLAECQRRLDFRFGAERLVAFLQRERYEASGAFAAVTQSGSRFGFEDVGARGPDAAGAAILVFLADDLPAPAKEVPIPARLAIGASFLMAGIFCNAVFLAVDALLNEGHGFLVGKTVQEASFSWTMELAVTRLDLVGVLPFGLGLLLVSLVQEYARGSAVKRCEAGLSDAAYRGGYFLPSWSWGSLGRTWGFNDLTPSRGTEFECAACGALAGIGASFLLCVLGLVNGNTSESLFLVEVTRLPFLLAQALGHSFPADASREVLGLSGNNAMGPAATTLVPLDPLLLAGAFGLTVQALNLLPLRGFDGHIVARYILGPRPVQFMELCTGVLLILGAFDRLGPNASPAIATSALAAWALRAYTSSWEPMPPREDFEDGSSPGKQLQVVIGTGLLAFAAAVLVPGRLVPYGLMPPP